MALESRVLCQIMTRARRLLFGQQLIIIIIFTLIIIPNTGASLLLSVITLALNTLSSKESLLRLVKFDVSIVGSRSNSMLGARAGLDARALTQTVLPVDGALGRCLDVIFDDLVGTWANLAWIVHQSTHLADVARVITVILRAIDNGRQEARWNTGHWHLLQTRVANSCSSASRRYGTDDCEGIDHGASRAAPLRSSEARFVGIVRSWTRRFRLWLSEHGICLRLLLESVGLGTLWNMSIVIYDVRVLSRQMLIRGRSVDLVGAGTYFYYNRISVHMY